jgi:YaaC-like Protein
MPLSPKAKLGSELSVKGKTVPYSFWPVIKVLKKERLQSLLFALDPWAIIIRKIHAECPTSSKPEALACIEQSRDFFNAATSGTVVASKPLVLYYSYMNLVKAFCLTRNQQPTFDKAQHGLSEKFKGSYFKINSASLEAFKSPNSKNELQNFDEFMKALTGVGLPSKTVFKLSHLLPQVVPGHRLWAEAIGTTERFISVAKIEYCKNANNNQVWLRLFFFKEDLDRLYVKNKQLLKESGLDTDFQVVQWTGLIEGKVVVCLEQKNATAYNLFPSKQLQGLSDSLRKHLWTTVSTHKPYRRYYVYLCTANETPARLPQLLSIYAITYYLGSITRYRPHHFDKIASGNLGPRFQDFIEGQPLQFLYLMASEFAKQEVTKPAIL